MLQVSPLVRPDAQKARADAKLKPKSGKVRTASQLERFNNRRRKTRNSENFAADVDCVQRPESGNAAAARWDKSKRATASKRERNQTARKWC